MNENHVADLPEDDGIKLLDILQTLAENARLLVFGPIIFGLVVMGVSFLFPPRFEATATIMTPQQSQGAAAAALAQLSSLVGMGGGGVGSGSQTAMYIGLLKSRTIADRMVDRFGLMGLRGIKTREDAREVLAKQTKITPGKDGLIAIQVVSTIPQVAAAVANTYVQELSLLTDRLAVTEAQGRRQFLEKELSKTKQNMTKAEISLGGAGVNEGALKFNPTVLGQGLATLKAQITAKELQLASMRGYLTENSIDFRLAQQELASLRGQMEKYETPPPVARDAQYIQRYRDFKYHEALFEQLSKQYELARIDESREGAVIQVVDVAVPPQRKENLHKAVVALIGWFVGGIMLLSYVFIRHVLKTASQGPESADKVAAIRAGFGRVLKPWRRSSSPGQYSAN